MKLNLRAQIIYIHYHALIDPGDEIDEFLPFQSTRPVCVVHFEIPLKMQNVSKMKQSEIQYFFTLRIFPI